MTASQALRPLETKGLITRRLSEEDSRTHTIELTRRGRDIAFKTVARLAAAHESFFKPLKRERRIIVSYLQRLIRANDLTDE